MSRLAILGISSTLDLAKTDLDYLQSSEIISDCFNVPIQNPSLFIMTFSFVGKIELTFEMLRELWNDKHSFLCWNDLITYGEIEKAKLELHCPVSLRERVFFALAKETTISFNKLNMYKYEGFGGWNKVRETIPA